MPGNVSAAEYQRRTNENDIPSLQLEVLKQIQSELVALRGDVSGLRSDMNKLDTRLSRVEGELHEGFTRLRTEIVELRGDMDVGFTAMRMMGDRRFLDHEERLRRLESAPR